MLLLLLPLLRLLLLQLLLLLLQEEEPLLLLVLLLLVLLVQCLGGLPQEQHRLATTLVVDASASYLPLQIRIPLMLLKRYS